MCNPANVAKKKKVDSDAIEQSMENLLDLWKKSYVKSANFTNTKNIQSSNLMPQIILCSEQSSYCTNKLVNDQIHQSTYVFPKDVNRNN